MQTKDQTLIPAGHHFTGQRLAKAILSEATKSLDILDPYVGTELFDRIDDSGIQLPIRILTTPKASNSLSYYKAFKQSYPKIELRLLQAAKLHDRFIIVDKAAGYHLGHSVKDLGKKKPSSRPSTIFSYSFAFLKIDGQKQNRPINTWLQKSVAGETRSYSYFVSSFLRGTAGSQLSSDASN